MALSLGLSALALGACEEEPGGDRPTAAFDLCCDCECTDGIESCRNFIIEDNDETSCEAVCADACRTVEDCPAVASAEICLGTPPPTGLNDLMCRDACNRVYQDCGLELTGDDDLPIPQDQCARFCENEVVPIGAVDCLAQIPCQELYILDCFEFRPYEVLSHD